MSNTFPSRLLVLLNIASCFFAAAVFGFALARIDTWAPSATALLPSTIGFLTTLPLHLYLYRYALSYARAASKGYLKDTAFLSIWAFIWIFLLVPLWLVILLIHIIASVEEPSAGMITSAVFSGCESLVSALLFMRCVWESWKVENTSKRPQSPEIPSGTNTEGVAPSNNTTPIPFLSSSPPVPKYRYFISLILATAAFISCVSPRLNQLVTVPAYLLTVTVHVSLFVSSGSSRRTTSMSSFEGVVIPLFLVFLWGDFVLANVLIRLPHPQRVLSKTFGMMECIVVAYISVRPIIQGFSPPENQIRLEEEED